MPVVLVGHVTKDGTLAGPKTLEHIVDVVLTLEGERFSGLRLLRASKNRFGSTEEVGVFEMAARRPGRGRRPGAAFLETRPARRAGRRRRGHARGQPAAAGRGPGAGRAAGPRLAAAHRRRARHQRLALLIAVLGRRAGSNLASHDVYASIVGGLTVEEPALDLPLALALASALRDRPIAPGTVPAARSA